MSGLSFIPSEWGGTPRIGRHDCLLLAIYREVWKPPGTWSEICTPPLFLLNLWLSGLLCGWLRYRLCGLLCAGFADFFCQLDFLSWICAFCRLGGLLCAGFATVDLAARFALLVCVLLSTT